MNSNDKESFFENHVSNGDLDSLRHKLRENKSFYREKQRELLLKKIRFLGDIQSVYNINMKEFLILIKKLKQKSLITCELLHAIMNTLLDSKENIKAFMSIDGSLQALLRCLSGQNEKFQLFAACCICNLALANAENAFKVLKASDSYLFAHLSGKNTYVMEACLIALGNFSSHGAKHIQLLVAQGFFAKMQHLLKSSNEFLESSYIYALTQVIYHGFDILRHEDILCALESIIPIFKKKSSSVIFLLSVLSSHKLSHEIIQANDIHIYALENLVKSLTNNEKECIYYLRLVSNCLCQSNGHMAVDIVQKHDKMFKESVKLLLSSRVKYLKKECLATIGILINHPTSLFVDFGLGVTTENLESIKEYFTTFQEEDMDIGLCGELKAN